MKEVCLTKEELELEYSAGKSLRQIAAGKKHDLKTILKLMRKYGLKRRSTKESWEHRKRAEFDAEAFARQYDEEGQSLGQIARNLHTSRGTLKLWAKRNGFRIKTISEVVSGKKKSEAHRHSISRGRKAMLSKHPELIQKIRENRLKQILPRETSIERILGEALTSRGVGYYKQLAILNTCQADLAFPDEKIAVFCDGDYWHRREDVKNKDKRVNGALIENGWRVMRFWERDIKTHPQEIADEVIKTLLERRYNHGLSSP